MFQAELYLPLYLLFVIIITCFLFTKYKQRNGLLIYKADHNEEIQAMVITSILIIFIGLRPVSGKYFVDMGGYAANYYAMEGTPFVFSLDVNNIIFDNYFAWVSSNNLGTEFFFTTIAAIYFGCAFFATKRLFRKDSLAAYIVFLAAFSTYSYSTNGIKAGAAASIFLLALSYRENLKICIILAFISWGFHHSMQLLVAALILSILYRKPKVYLIIWCVCIILAVFHVTYFQNLFAGLTDEQGASYLDFDSQKGGISGFRIDFILYSAMPVLVGYYALLKKKIQLSKHYISLFNIYLITNSIWMLCMYAEFTNRIAYLSWFLYPVVLIYPFLNENWGQSRYKSFSRVMMAHLGFTLFMQFIYYA